MSSPPTAPPTADQRKVTDLEQIGRRLAEELTGLEKQDAYLADEIASHEAALVTAHAALDKLPKDASATAVFEAKRGVIGIEFNIGRLKEQRADLSVELAETPGLIQANEKALAKARAES